MARINVGGIDQVQTRPPALPPLKTALVRVSGAEAVDFDGKGGKIRAINWELTVLEGQYANRKVYHKTNYDVDPAELATWKSSDFDYRGPLKQFLEACGGGWDPDGFDTENFIGRELTVDVTQREYEGELYNDVKRPKAIAGSNAPQG